MARKRVGTGISLCRELYIFPRCIVMVDNGR